MDRLARVIDAPINFMMWLSCFVGMLMMLHITADVFGRVVFNHPLEGTIEIVSREMWETATGFVDIWPNRWMLPIGCALMVVYLIFRIFQDIRNAEQS